MKGSVTRETASRARKKRPQPTWDIATLFPEQGNWSEEEYLDLPGNHLVELSDGFLEFPPMPTTLHQWIMLFLYETLKAFTGEKLGLVLTSALPVKLRPGKFREPDVVFMLKEHRHRVHDQYWEGADLVMEVVSADPKSRQRDLVTKRAEYARAGIPEYWIVDPATPKISVLWLEGKRYASHGVFKKGQRATSRLLPGFTVEVAAAFAGPAM